jgi:hypothetical protein
MLLDPIVQPSLDLQNFATRNPQQGLYAEFFNNYTGLGQNNIVGKDPQFIDPANHNFRLRSNSPAIDSGVDRPEIQSDFYNCSRAGIRDVGAIEFSQ